MEISRRGLLQGAIATSVLAVGDRVAAARSGMGDTRNGLTSTGAADVVKDAGAQLVVLDEVEREAWAPMRGAHWPNGFHAARVFTDAPCVVQTMCCKTHRFGGHVTLSL